MPVVAVPRHRHRIGEPSKADASLNDHLSGGLTCTDIRNQSLLATATRLSSESSRTISGCPGQKELSLEDQADHARQFVTEMTSGPTEYRVIATKGKGERLDRPELIEIEKMLRTRELDLLLVEDIGRLIRGAAAMRLCGVGVDHGVRVISMNDGLDTDDDTWEEDVLSACRDHVGHNVHASRRLKQKL